MSTPPSRLPLAVGLVLILAGWGAIFAGWYQAARQELESGQIPYVVSGGFGGLGLLLLGATGILVHVIQRTGWLQRQAAEELARAAQAMHSESLGPSTAGNRRAERSAVGDGDVPKAPRRGRRRAASG